MALGKCHTLTNQRSNTALSCLRARHNANPERRWEEPGRRTQDTGIVRDWGHRAGTERGRAGGHSPELRDSFQPCQIQLVLPTQTWWFLQDDINRQQLQTSRRTNDPREFFYRYRFSELLSPVGILHSYHHVPRNHYSDTGESYFYFTVRTFPGTIKTQQHRDKCSGDCPRSGRQRQAEHL